MNHAVTIGGLLLALLAFGGFCAALLGLLILMAGASSDAPGQGDAAVRRGCLTMFAGLIVFIVALWLLH